MRPSGKWNGQRVFLSVASKGVKGKECPCQEASPHPSKIERITPRSPGTRTVGTRGMGAVIEKVLSSQILRLYSNAIKGEGK